MNCAEFLVVGVADGAAAGEVSAHISICTGLESRILPFWLVTALSRLASEDKTHSRSSEMERAPFRMIVDLGQQLLCFSVHLPSLKMRLLALGLQTIPFPVNVVSSVSTDPLAIHVHIDVHINIALDIDCNVGCWNRLSQSRCRSDWRKE